MGGCTVIHLGSLCLKRPLIKLRLGLNMSVNTYARRGRFSIVYLVAKMNRQAFRTSSVNADASDLPLAVLE